MRTKDKARRRVKSFRSLEPADKCMYSERLQSENVVVLGKRAIPHLDEANCGSASVAKRPCNSNCVTSRNPNEKEWHNLVRESLQGLVDTGELNGARKRKAAEVYELPEFAPGKGQGFLTSPVPASPTSPVKKKCAQTEPSLFSLLGYFPLFDTH